MAEKMSEAKKMEIMHAWLADVSQALELDEGIATRVAPPMLDLIRDVAHGPSRPGAPMTAMLVGLAAGLGAQSADTDAIAERITEGVRTVHAVIEERSAH
ncbi:MAG: DUF6457 domain-containing protein [Bowdeniella nasicola]|nr:DUF6457 domain-containing protein [Bowdeniella nasicola]